MGVLNEKPGRNWIENLPASLRDAWDKSIIYRAAVHMHQERGMPVGMAIASAINWCKHIAATGDVKQWPGPQSVRPSSRAECVDAVALWESMKAVSHAGHGTRTSHDRSEAVALALAGTFNSALHPHQAAGSPTGGQFAPARNQQAAAAQKAPGAQQAYNTAIAAKPGDVQAQVAAMDNEKLAALTRAAYSFKSSDPKVVALRLKLAGEIVKRGGNPADFGALNGRPTPGGPKPLKGGPAPAKPAMKPPVKPAAPKRPAPRTAARPARRVLARPAPARTAPRFDPTKPGATATAAQAAAATTAAKARHATLNSAHGDTADDLALSYRYRHGWVLIDGNGKPVAEKKNKSSADIAAMKASAIKMGPNSKAAADYRKAAAETGGAPKLPVSVAKRAIISTTPAVGERRKIAAKLSDKELHATDKAFDKRAINAGAHGQVDKNQRVVKQEIAVRDAAKGLRTDHPDVIKAKIKKLETLKKSGQLNSLAADKQIRALKSKMAKVQQAAKNRVRLSHGLALSMPMVSSQDGPMVTVNNGLSTPHDIRRAVIAHGKVPPQLRPGYRNTVRKAAKRIGAMHHVPATWMSPTS